MASLTETCLFRIKMKSRSNPTSVKYCWKVDNQKMFSESWDCVKHWTLLSLSFSSVVLHTRTTQSPSCTDRAAEAPILTLKQVVLRLPLSSPLLAECPPTAWWESWTWATVRSFQAAMPTWSTAGWRVAATTPLTPHAPHPRWYGSLCWNPSRLVY